MVTSFNLFTSVAWIVAGVISAIISILFLLKNPKKRLNQLFSTGFVFWSISLFFNGLNFAVAYRSLFAANICRDLAIFTGIFSAIFLFISAIGIYFGAEKLHWSLYIISLAVATVLSVFGSLNDWVVVDGLGGYKTTDNLFGKTCVQLIPAVFVIVGAILLVMTYFTLKNKSAKKRIGYFIIGFSTIIIGLLMFLIDSLVNISPYIFPTLAILTWVTGPILMLAGFYVKVDVSLKYLPAPDISTLESKTLDPKQIERPS
ncbi:MAG TPA: hypothetical protein VMZ29_09730 [Candidatus Bathyarchaeia archaeon]|nr:hypothetical protein [Candidatus Bathyarchaeia archaeon]